MTAPTPLKGVKVLDLTTILMGPLATQILADNGADVVKVERTDGDLVRSIGPSRTEGMGPLFQHLNRGKTSIALDLKDARCLDALMKLAAKADILVHNLRPKVAARLGIGFEAVKAVNPRIVYCSLYGYGQDGPYADRAAFDDLIQGAAAIPSLQDAAGEDGPRFVPLNLADRMVGFAAAYAMMMGLFARDRSGAAQEIDVPMFETLAAQVLSEHMFGETFVPPLGPAGYPRLISRARRPYATSDGHVCVVIYTNAHWKRFLEDIGRADLIGDARFATVNGRLAHIGEVYGFLADTLRAETTAHWLETFDRLDIPASPLNTVSSLMTDPHLVAAGVVKEIDHPTEGRVRTIANPVLWGGRRTETGHAPTLGEHTLETLRAAGVPEEELAALVADGAIVDSGRPAEPSQEAKAGIA